MDQILLTAAAGMRSRLEALELIGNNIANANTAGFKADREFYNLFLGLDAESGAQGEFRWMPVVEGSAIDFRQGVLTPTGAALDLALSGPGFFVVEGPDGPLFTRNGAFRRSSAGRLETLEGYPLQGERGPLVVLPGEVKIAEDGAVWVGGAAVGRIRVVEFPAGTPLLKVGRTYFRPAVGAQPAPAAAAIRQGHLEAANVNPAEAGRGHSPVRDAGPRRLARRTGNEPPGRGRIAPHRSITARNSDDSRPL
jgi:flagellar basal-body rod protein FlgF